MTNTKAAALSEEFDIGLSLALDAANPDHSSGSVLAG
jgi:hypothetical protein